MTCAEILNRLDEWAERTLPATELAAIAAHLEHCPGCRAEAEALQALLAQARGMPRSVLPARDLWPGIEARLDRAPGPRLRPRWFTPRPLLVAAAIGGLLLGATLATLWQRQGARREFVLEQSRYAQASADLARALAANPAALAPETRAVVERALNTLDQAIAEAEAALAADPRNASLEQMLVARYEQRLDLLRRAAAVGGSAS